jgi:hypothetical protein
VATRQYVFSQPTDADSGQAESLGSRSEIVKQLAQCNTAPDTESSDCLHGPGMIIQIPPQQDDITQLLVSVFTEDYAWPVLIRICKETHWQLLDLETGRAFSAN